ncbi:MAG: hypothetical protein IPK04_18605 [Bdellovibrionales bacterium]|nr:hypothetical protein [Bdellovibrionales bacterium]
MKKKIITAVIEPVSITLTKKQDKWILKFIERDHSDNNRQERIILVDVKVMPPKEKFIIVRYEETQGTDYLNFISFEESSSFFGKNKNDGGGK